MVNIWFLDSFEIHCQLFFLTLAPRFMGNGKLKKKDQTTKRQQKPGESESCDTLDPDRCSVE